MNDNQLLDYLAGCSATYSEGELDIKIYRCVEGGMNNFNGIVTTLGYDPKEVAPKGKTPMWRRIDRRLQWMRKNRFLHFNRNKGWKALDPKKSAGAA